MAIKNKPAPPKIETILAQCPECGIRHKVSAQNSLSETTPLPSVECPDCEFDADEMGRIQRGPPAMKRIGVI